MNIAQNINSIKAEISPEVTVIAISKTKPVELLEEAYQSGQLDFGEKQSSGIGIQIGSSASRH